MPTKFENLKNRKEDNADRALRLLAEEMKSQMKERNISYDDSISDPFDVVCNYLDNDNKWVYTSGKGFNIKVSKELQKKLDDRKFDIVDRDGKHIADEDILAAYKKIVDGFKNGEDMNFHSSKNIYSADGNRIDTLLNAWNIHHIHLSTEESHSQTSMENNRSAYLLMYFVSGNTIYCLDIIAHPKRNKFFIYNHFLAFRQI